MSLVPALLLCLASLATAPAQAIQETLLVAAGIDARARFGVANALDNIVFPRAGPSGGSVAFDSVYLPGLFNYTQLYCASGGPCQRPVDVTAGSFAFNANTKYVGVYYASSMNYTRLRNDRSVGLDPMVALLAPVTTAFLAPISVGPVGVLGQVDEGLLSSSMELSLGARLFLPLGAEEVLTGTVGYYAAADREGLYTSLTERQLRLAFSAILSQEIPYLLAGFQRARWMWRGVDSPGERELGSSLFVRKLSLQKSDEVLPSGSAQAATVPPLWTGHVEQFGLGPVDLHLALAFQPTVLLHEARLRYTRQHIELTGGAVQLPAAPWLLAEGGWFPTASLALVPGGEGTELIGDSRISVELNTPEVLTAFPYARSAVLCRMTFIVAGAAEEW